MTYVKINPYKLFVGAFLPNWLLNRTEISLGAKICYARLCQYAGKNGICYPSQETLAKEVGLSTIQIKRYLKELTDNKLIVSKRRGLKKTNLYFFVWHVWMESDHQEFSEVSDMIPQEVSDTTLQEVSDMIHKENQYEENHCKRDESYDSSNAFCSKKRTRKRKNKLSLKDKTKQKAQNKHPKKKKSQRILYENIPNTQLIGIWNQQENLRKHHRRDSNVYKQSLRKLEMLRNGILFKIVSEDMLQSDVPYEWFNTEWKKSEISKAIKTLNNWCKEGNYPIKKDWIKKLSLSDAIFNSRTGSPLMQAFKKGVQRVYDPMSKLETEAEQKAYTQFEKFFSKHLNKRDLKTQKQIVDLVHNLRKQRESFSHNWNRYDPDYFGYGVAPASVEFLALDYVEFLQGKYPTDFTPNTRLTPNGLKIGTHVWGRFHKAFDDRFDADPISGPK